jgi:hypothetical protein
MGHIDSPGRSRLNRDIHFEKSPYLIEFLAKFAFQCSNTYSLFHMTLHFPGE